MLRASQRAALGIRMLSMVWAVEALNLALQAAIS